MGEIAESLLDGEFDCITGEYLGEGVGYPRTLHGNGKLNPVKGVQNYLQNKGIIAKEKKREIVKLFCEQNLLLNYEIIGFDKCCIEIQKCFGEFIKFVKGYKKGAFK